eukprot:gnl/TRDRNA2_/TRDRNA2_167352_c1_seq3.p1 gnl/TRDRNA2_/TRDRNA2_167352_c1~~gnl/TRDRNA2_/TRDRNA2_167352_c1_seq3.p1  ORF type:complete len:188 (+),score=35.96 gnl/TRDRNA2_/TRDRNA2_167352_c1_seq3:31-594(+)
MACCGWPGTANIKKFFKGPWKFPQNSSAAPPPAMEVHTTADNVRQFFGVTKTERVPPMQAADTREEEVDPQPQQSRDFGEQLSLRQVGESLHASETHGFREVPLDQQYNKGSDDEFNHEQETCEGPGVPWEWQQTADGTLAAMPTAPPEVDLDEEDRLLKQLATESLSWVQATIEEIDLNLAQSAWF